MSTADAAPYAVARNLLGRIGVMAVIVMVLAVAAYERNAVWYTLLQLWEDAALKSPLKSRVHNNLGNCNMLLERYFAAIEEYKMAVAFDKGNIEAYYNLGTCLEQVGFGNQALQYYDVFCKNAPPQYAEQKQSSCARAEALAREFHLNRPSTPQ